MNKDSHCELQFTGGRTAKNNVGRTMAEKQSTRRERERSRHREEIVAAAEAIFTEKGFHGASVQDIAERAEFAVGTLYKFFKGKEELYEALFFRKIREIAALIYRAMEGAADPVGKLERLIETNLKIADIYSSFFGLYLREFAGTFTVSPLAKPHIMRLHQQFVDRVEGVMKAGMEQGALRRGDPGAMTMALIGMLRGCGSMWVQDRKGASLDELTDTVKKLFFTGALANEGRGGTAKIGGARRSSKHNEGRSAKA